MRSSPPTSITPRSGSAASRVMTKEWALARRPQEVVGAIRMKVAQVMAGSPAGGAELFFERLTIALAGAGETVLPVIRRNAGRAGRLASAGLSLCSSVSVVRST